MAIKNNDVKLSESHRLSDEKDGGGRVTGREVIDGNVNNRFQDIFRIDRTVGNVALRKAFIGISSDNIDTYPGSHLILTEPPEKLGSGPSLCEYLYLSLKRQLLCIIRPEPDFLRINEFDWNPVAQSTERSLSGALLV